MLLRTGDRSLNVRINAGWDLVNVQQRLQEKAELE